MALPWPAVFVLLVCRELVDVCNGSALCHKAHETNCIHGCMRVFVCGTDMVVCDQDSRRGWFCFFFPRGLGGSGFCFLLSLWRHDLYLLVKMSLTTAGL